MIKKSYLDIIIIITAKTNQMYSSLYNMHRIYDYYHI